jgi:hypothetical protein
MDLEGPIKTGPFNLGFLLSGKWMFAKYYEKL